MAIQKSCLLMQIQDMDQNRYFFGMIDHEAIQARVDTHLGYSFCGKSFTLQTTKLS